MKKTLYELFMMGQEGDEKAKLELYKKFLPRIKKFGRKLFYEEAETDLTIFLLEFINNVNLEKFQNQTIISGLSEKLNIVEDIKNDISEIKNSFKK